MCEGSEDRARDHDRSRCRTSADALEGLATGVEMTASKKGTEFESRNTSGQQAVRWLLVCVSASNRAERGTAKEPRAASHQTRVKAIRSQ